MRSTYVVSNIAGVITTPPAPRRTGIARLVLVLAALAGIALLQNAHCPAGMAMAAPASMSAVACAGVQSAADHDIHMPDPGDSVVQAAVVSPEVSSDHSGPALPTGIAMACLAVFLALLAALALPRLSGHAYTLLLSLPLRGPRPRSVPPRPPSLAELCVLRT